MTLDLLSQRRLSFVYIHLTDFRVTLCVQTANICTCLQFWLGWGSFALCLALLMMWPSVGLDSRLFVLRLHVAVQPILMQTAQPLNLVYCGKHELMLLLSCANSFAILILLRVFSVLFGFADDVTIRGLRFRIICASITCSCTTNIHANWSTFISCLLQNARTDAVAILCRVIHNRKILFIFNKTRLS